MAATRTHEDVVALMETRFDYLSARNVLSHALQVAGLETKKSYSGDDLAVLAGALSTVATHTVGVADALTGGGPAVSAPPAKAAAEEKKAEAPAAAEKAEAPAAAEEAEAPAAAEKAKAPAAEKKAPAKAAKKKKK